MAICYILWPFGIFYGHLVYFVVIWYNFPRFGMLYQEKSGNHAATVKLASAAPRFRFSGYFMD
jgi:hypothetical protein